MLVWNEWVSPFTTPDEARATIYHSCGMFVELQIVNIPQTTILRFNSEYLFTMPENMRPHAELLVPTHVNKVCIRVASNGEVRIASWNNESITLTQAFAYIFYPTSLAI